MEVVDGERREEGNSGKLTSPSRGAEGGGLSCARCKQGEPKTEDLATLGIEGRRGVL